MNRLRAAAAVPGLLALVAASVGTAAAQEVELETRRLGPGLWVVHGAPHGNVLVVEGSDGVLLVDAQSAPVSSRLDSLVSTLSGRPVRWVISTHYHEDHIGGNSVFRGQGARVYAHPNMRAQAVIDTVIDDLGWEREAADPDDLADVEISNEAEFGLGGRFVRVLHVPAAHTDGDLIVILGETNVIHTGDLAEFDAYPFLDWWGGGSLDGMIAGVNVLLGLGDEGTRYVPGHGGVVDRDELEAYRDMLVTVAERVKAAVEGGMEWPEIGDAGLTSEYDDERGGARAGRRFVGILYLGLSGASDPAESSTN